MKNASGKKHFFFENYKTANTIDVDIILEYRVMTIRRSHFTIATIVQSQFHKMYKCAVDVEPK